MDFQQQTQQQQNQNLLLAAALWPPQRAAALATMLRNNNNNSNLLSSDNNNNSNNAQLVATIMNDGTTDNINNGTGAAAANAESVILAQLHQTHQPPPASAIVRQIIQSPIGSAGTIRLFDPAQGIPLGAATVPEALIAAAPNHHHHHHHQQQHQLVDQLVMAAAFQQMMERLRAGGVPPEAAAATPKFVPPPPPAAEQQLFGDNNHHNTMGLAQPQQMPPNFGSLSSNLSSSSSSSSSSVPPQQHIKTEPVKKSSSENAEDCDARQTAFVPTPTTTADELIGHALARLMEQLDTEGTEAADDGHFQEGPSSSDGTSTIFSRTNSAHEEVLLCKVCSDKASGFHYGIFSCEGCKGFFRRSLQNKIDYRPCTQSQKCQIVRASRNRCQECRWRKCIEAGMSKDSVRYGRVPKREKEKMREEMRRDSARSAMEQLGAELEDEKSMVDQLECAFADLGTEMAGRLDFFENSELSVAASVCPAALLDARRYMQMVQWVCRFASRIRGFRLLRREERVRLIRDAHFPVLLLRLCSLRRRRFGPSAMDDKVSTGQMDKVSNGLLVGLASVPKCLMVPSSAHNNGPLLAERIVEFVHRIREAQPPVGLCPTDRQLSLIAALCLCRSEGAGEHAAGALLSASVPTAATAAGGDDSAGHAQQLQLAIARRIHERLWQSLNSTLATDLLRFGPSPLRRDSMEREHLAAMLEALRQLRMAHRQCLAHTNCCNVPAELFTATTATATTIMAGQRRGNIANGTGAITATPRALRDESATTTKRRKIAAAREDGGTAAIVALLPPKEEPHQQHTVAATTVASSCSDATMVAVSSSSSQQQQQQQTATTTIVYGTNTVTTSRTTVPKPTAQHQQQQHTHQLLVVDDLPTLRRELERPPAIVNAAVAAATTAMVAGGVGALSVSSSPCVSGHASATTTMLQSMETSQQLQQQSPLSYTQQSPYSQRASSLSSLRELLARPPILHVVVQQQQQQNMASAVLTTVEQPTTTITVVDEQPLNLCVRDRNHCHAKKNGREI